MTIGTEIITTIAETTAETQMTIEAQIMTAIGAEIIIAIGITTQAWVMTIALKGVANCQAALMAKSATAAADRATEGLTVGPALTVVGWATLHTNAAAHIKSKMTIIHSTEVTIITGVTITEAIITEEVITGVTQGAEVVMPHAA